MANPVAAPLSSLRARSVPNGVVISAPLVSVALSPLSPLRLVSRTVHPLTIATKERRRRVEPAVSENLDLMCLPPLSLTRCHDRALQAGSAVRNTWDRHRTMSVDPDLTEQGPRRRRLRDTG